MQVWLNPMIAKLFNPTAPRQSPAAPWEQICDGYQPKRKASFESQDAVDQRHQALIAGIEAKLTQSTSASSVVAFRWRMV